MTESDDRDASTGRDPEDRPDSGTGQQEPLVSIWAGLRHRWVLASLAALLYWLAAHSLRPMVPLRLDQLGASDMEIGVAVAGFSTLSLLLAIPGGRMVDRLGILRILVVSLTGMALVGAGYAVAATPVQILLLSLVTGVVELGVWLALQALISSAGSGSFLSRHLSLFSFGWGVGAAAGPMIGSFVFGRIGFAPLGWLYATLALVAMTAAFVPYQDREGKLDADKSQRPSSLAMIKAIAARPAVKGVLISTYIALFVNAIRLSFYPLYLERDGVDVARIGVLLSIIGTTSLLIRLPLPAMLRRWGGGRVLVWSLWLCVVPIAATPWIEPYWLLVVTAAVIGAAYGVNPPVTVELMARHTKPMERGLAMGMRLTSNRLAQIVQPLLFGGLASTVGMAAAFPVSGLVLGGLTVWTWREAERISSTRTVS